jgi:hypothetical protein
MPTLIQLKQAVALAERIEKLQTELASIIGRAEFPAVAAKVVAASAIKTGKRTMSPEARERIAAAQRARWAKSKGSSTPVAKPLNKSTSGKRFVSAESRAKMAAAQHARWARKNGASATPAAKPVKKKGGLSPEGRARIVAALKARHAAAKKAKG